MTELFNAVIDCATQEVTMVPLSEEEVQGLEALHQEALAQEQAMLAQHEARVAAKESAIAKLEAIGLSQEEILAIIQ